MKYTTRTKGKEYREIEVCINFSLRKIKEIPHKSRVFFIEHIDTLAVWALFYDKAIELHVDWCDLEEYLEENTIDKDFFKIVFSNAMHKKIKTTALRAEAKEFNSLYTLEPNK